MRKTSNLDLRLYDASDKFDITNTSNSLNSNMEIIDEQVNNLNNNIKGIDELKKETNSLKEDIDNIVPTLQKTVVTELGKNTDGIALLDGYYIGTDGAMSQLNAYYTYIYQITKSGKLYFDDTPTNSTVLMFAVYDGYPSADTWAGTRYRLSDGNLPSESNKLTVTEGQYIAISVYLNVSVSNLYWTLYHEDTEGIKDTFGNIKLNIKQIEQAEKSSKIHLKYVNGNGLDNSTEKIEVYIPTYIGFIRYDLLHCISEEKNADIWRVGYVYSVDDNFSNAKALTVFGEWECAIHLNNSGDYTGGITHGNEVLSNVIFMADGGLVDITLLTELTSFKEFTIVQASNMYDSADGTTLFAIHGSEHKFSIDGLKISQTVDWKITSNVTWCYMAMHLPSKTYTDRFYRNNNIVPSLIEYGLFPNTKRTVVYGSESGVKTEFSIEDYPSGLNGGDTLLTADNGGNPYNKCYYVVTSSANIPNDTVWKSVTKYKFDCNKELN